MRPHVFYVESFIQGPEAACSLHVAAAHPFRKEREKDGARKSWLH